MIGILDALQLWISWLNHELTRNMSKTIKKVERPSIQNSLLINQVTFIIACFSHLLELYISPPAVSSYNHYIILPPITYSHNVAFYC